MKGAVWSFGLGMLMSCVGWAQENPVTVPIPAVKTHAVTVPASVAEGKLSAKKALTREEQIASDLLASSLAGSGKLDAVSQGQLMWDQSRIYMKHFDDQDKAAALLKEGFFRALSVRDEQPERLENARATVEARLLTALVPINVVRTEELLGQAEGKARNPVQSVLVSYYLGHGKDGRALELVRQMATENEMSYRDAITLMSHMKVGQESLRRDLFVEALASYSAHEHGSIAIGNVKTGNADNGDFTAMILRFSGQLPRTLVVQAIEEVLSQAKRADAERVAKKGYLQAHLVAAKGDATFTSLYDYQLFALLPALRAADPVTAEARIKDSALVRALFAKYENGMLDLTPVAGGGEYQFLGSISTGDSPVQVESPDPEMQKRVEIGNEIGEHPDNAMAQIRQMRSSWLRVESYLEVARVHWRKHPAVAREALRKVLEESEPQNPNDPQQGGRVYTDMAQIYMQMDDPESAKKALEKGTAVAAKLYQGDINSDDPNEAPECFWPSSTVWLLIVRSGAKISPQFAMELLKTAPSEEVVSLGQTVIAASLLKTEFLAPETMAIHKGRESLSSGEQDQDDKKLEQKVIRQLY